MKEVFEFSKSDKLDYRSIFANNVCQLIYKDNKGDLFKSTETLKEIYDDFKKYVRNIYELIENEIPLFALYDLVNGDADNWDFTFDEYNEAIERTKIACHEFYCKSIITDESHLNLLNLTMKKVDFEPYLIEKYYERIYFYKNFNIIGFVEDNKIYIIDKVEDYLKLIEKLKKVSEYYYN